MLGLGDVTRRRLVVAGCVVGLVELAGWTEGCNEVGFTEGI